MGPCQAAGGPPGRGGLVVGAPLCWRAFFAQRFAGERETVMALHEPIKHGVGHGLVTYPFVPVFDGQLTGNDGGAVACPVVNDLQQIGPGLTVHGRHAPVVQHKHVGVFERVKPARKRAVGVANAQLLTQARNPQVQRTVTAPAGMLGQGARKPGLASAGTRRPLPVARPRLGARQESQRVMHRRRPQPHRPMPVPLSQHGDSMSAEHP